MAKAKNKSKLAVLFADEIILQRKTPGISRCWTIKGVQPQIPFELGHHERLHLFGAINPQTGDIHIRKCSRIDSYNFIRFLKQTKNKYPGKSIILIIDNAAWHHAKKVHLAIERSKINLFFLPAYSPDLNPIERLWKRLRKDVTHNAFFQSMESLKNALARFFRYLKGNRKEVISLCQLS